MIRLAICDDAPEVVERIETYINNIKNIVLDYEVFFSAEELEKYILNNAVDFDVYLLDIEMKVESGLELARNIREKNANALIVFMTSHSQYVYDVFEVITFDFILKPITFDKFKHLLEKIEKHFGMVKNKFVFSFKKNTYSILFQKITHLEKHGRKVLIYTTDGNIYESNMNLEQVWKQLDEDMFASLYKSCIVNLEEITTIMGDKVILKNGTSLYVSREYKKQLKEKHLKYLKGSYEYSI